jgi:hypothetical protein
LRNELRSSPKAVTPLGGLDQRLLLPEELLRTVVQPVLLIWAEDPNGGEATTLAFVGGMPDTTLDILPEAGHSPGSTGPTPSPQ